MDIIEVYMPMRKPQEADLEKIKEIETKRIILWRVGTPEDVAEVGLFLPLNCLIMSWVLILLLEAVCL